MSTEHKPKQPLKAGLAMNTEHPLNMGPSLDTATATNTGIKANPGKTAEIGPVPDTATAHPTGEALMPQRAVGGMLVLVGIVVGYSTVYRPLQDAAHGVASLSLSMKMTAVTPVLLVFGITLLLFPKFALHHFGGYHSQMPKTAAGWVYMIAVVALGFGFWFWMQARLRNYGYSF